LGRTRCLTASERARPRRALLFASLLGAFALGVLSAPVPALASSASVGFQLSYAADPGESNDVTIMLVGSDYVIHDSGAIITAGSGCNASLDMHEVSCPASGLQSCVDAAAGDPFADPCIVITLNDMNDTGIVCGSLPSCSGQILPVTVAANIDGGLGSDTLTGGDGNDHLFGGPIGGLAIDGPDVLDGGLGGDEIQGGIGGGDDTLTYSHRTNPVSVNLSAAIFGGFGGEGCDPSQTNCGGGGENDFPIASIEKVVGGSGDDVLIGSEAPNVLNGGPGGSDTLCGGLGPDTVDYSDRSAPVHVSLDGSLPTDPRLNEQTPNTSEPAARTTCIVPFGGQPALPGQTPPSPGQTDCVPNDGADGEHDCVGEDVEDVTGGSGDDTLVGNSPNSDQCFRDPQHGDQTLVPCIGPKVEPRGANRLVGGAG